MFHNYMISQRHPYLKGKIPTLETWKKSLETIFSQGNPTITQEGSVEARSTWKGFEIGCVKIGKCPNQ